MVLAPHAFGCSALGSRARALTVGAILLACVTAAPACKSHRASSGSEPKRPTGVTVRTGVMGAGEDRSATDNRLGFPSLDAGWAEAGYRLNWVGYPFVNNTKANGLRRMAAWDDCIVSQDQTSTISLLDAKTGQTKWSVDLDAPLSKFVGLTRDPLDQTRVVISSESEAVTMALGSGNIIGHEKFEKVVNTAPIADGGIFVYGTAAGEVMGHRMGLALKGWGFQGVGPIEADPVRVAGAVGTVSQAGDVTFLDSRNGSLLGRAHIFGGLSNNPVVAGDAIVIAGMDQSVWSFATSGQERWRIRTPHPLTAQPTAIETMVYLDIPEQGLTAIDSNSGKATWNNPKVKGTVVAQRAGNLLVYTSGTLSIVDKARGDLIRAVPVPGIVRIQADKIVDGNLYAVSDRNVVAKLSPR